MSVTTDSIDKATRLNQIGFPEFTSKLINDVFNAIVSANLNQQKAYVDLVKELSKTLREYITETKDSISGTDILNFLVKIAPDINKEFGDAGTIITSSNINILTDVEAEKINKAVAVDEINLNVNVANTTSQVSDLYKPILEAVAARIAADKYSLLNDMVKQGVVRLVVNGGEIQTSLNFEAKDSTFYEKNSDSYNRDEFNFTTEVSSGSAVAQFINIAASAQYTKVGTSTVKLNNNITSSSQVQIAGMVKLNFSTDYQPLTQVTQG